MTNQSPSSPEGIALARNVLANPQNLSHLPEDTRERLIGIAWRALHLDRAARLPQAERPANLAPPPAPPQGDKVVSLAIWKARQRIKARMAARIDTGTTRRVPQIVIRPADPANPGDAA